MSDDEVDLELLDLLRKRFGIGNNNDGPPETKVLENAQFIYDNSVDVALDMRSTKAAAKLVLQEMEKREYSTKTWSEHELHPKAKDESTVNFIFTMDLLNFSFWSEKSGEDRFAVIYKGKRWTGYWSLVALLQRALEQEIPITDPDFWIDEEKCTDEVLRTVFASGTDEEISMLDERIRCLREAGRILDEVGQRMICPWASGICAYVPLGVRRKRCDADRRRQMLSSRAGQSPRRKVSLLQR